ncbi:recombinase family protein [Curtobacterium luteum]|uniref:recombinase family protein n=1 Tax=Curtobacterium luteum TaxID=33881 RepID=UPI0038058295
MNPSAATAFVSKPLAVMYLRVSTKDQAGRGGEAEGFSIPAQREACMRKADALGLQLVEEFVDAGESARSANRPELKRMLKYVEEHRVATVIVHKVDRLARNRVDDVEINLALTKAGAQLVSCTENIDETPSGMLLHGIMSSIAEFYSRNLATESRKGMLQKAKNGGTVNAVPFGYLNVHARTAEGRDMRTVALDPERAEWVPWIFERYAGGDWTVSMIRDELNKHGVTTLPRPSRPSAPIAISHVHAILKNRYYVGIVKYEGVEYPGKHPALVSEELFARAKQVRESRVQSREKPRVHSHYLKGTLYCGQCGEPLTFEQSRNRAGNLYDYFYCLGRQRLKNGCTFKATQAHVLEALVERHWETVTLTDARIAEIRRLVLSHVDTLMPNQQREQDRARRTLRELETQLDRLMQAYYADAVPMDRMKQEQMRIAESRAAAEATISKHSADQDLILEKLDYLFALLADASRYYANAPDTNRRDLNHSVFDRLYIDDDEVTGSDVTEPFRRLLSDSLELDLARDRKRMQTPVVRTNDLRNRQRSYDLPTEVGTGTTEKFVQTATDGVLVQYLALERPRGRFPWERKNLGPLKDRGSNDYFLVAGAGFEPTTSGL